MYFLASSGAVFEDPIKADPNWSQVLVVDPDDPAQAEAFARAYIDVHNYAGKPWETRTQESRDQVIGAVQAAFRAMLVEPKPDKPEEPTGLGAVVEGNAYTEKLRTFVRTSREKDAPWSDEDGNGHLWSEIDVERVLSEGVPS